jgi:acetyl esterase/lipase
MDRWRVLNAVSCAIVSLASSAGPALAQTLSWRDVLARTTAAPQHVVAYGEDPLQRGELYLPEGPGPHPVVLLVHGGCWLASLPGVELMAPMAEQLRSEHVAVWNVEYRRVGHPGGGYPGTFQDVARAAEHLRVIAAGHALDLDRVVAVGHSAGGHLALWLASRPRLPGDSPLRARDPLPLRGVVSLGGIPDLEEWQRFGSRACGEDTIAALVDNASRGEAAFRDTSPSRLLPVPTPQVLVYGVFDAIAPPFLGLRYRDAARRSGGDAALQIVPDAGHFEVIAPWTPAWEAVSTAIHELLRQR